MVYGKFTLVAASTKSISANFNKFYLPEGQNYMRIAKMVR